MTETGSSSPTGMDDQVDARPMLSDGELEEVVAEAIISQVVAEAEIALLGATAAPLPDAERIRRLDQDRRLVEALRSTDFEGPRFEAAYRKLRQALLEYAYPVVGSLINTGTIFAKTSRYRQPLSRDAQAAAMLWTAEERHDAIDDSIAWGSAFFLEYGLKRGKWDHRRGATLSTYFVGACICGFIGVCNDRWKHRQLELAFVQSAPHRETEAGVHEDVLHSIPARGLDGRDPAEVAAARDEVARAMSKIKSVEVREALLLQADGMTQAEAAGVVGLSPKGLERRLSHQRSKFRPPNMISKTEDEG
ncbi:hypothetical protein FHX81_3758 [Saccharothrix saharensis]|uniref:Uncharacterized protein n=1 Tax=Saccharothrix saharensis TaxID=571190 RepID=A0A543JEX4_9PSEU|nr:hypothetical protein [Saccharothrix saharensis]TQM81393.1 hypothetical protein FHX81_3758 [Saccharothrix saharensis]